MSKLANRRPQCAPGSILEGCGTGFVERGEDRREFLLSRAEASVAPPVLFNRSSWSSATGHCYQQLLREEPFLFPASMIPRPQSLSVPCLLDLDGPITHPLCLRQYERQRSELHPSMKSQTPSQAEVIHFGCLRVSIRLSRADARI